MAAARAALIEQKHMIALRVEQRTMKVLGAAARAAVQKYARSAAALTNLLNIYPMAIAHVDHARVEGAQGCGGMFIHVEDRGLFRLKRVFVRCPARFQRCFFSLPISATAAAGFLTLAPEMK